MITHWQNILKGKRMSKRNITFIIMIITLMTLPLSACGKNKNNISTDNSQKLQSESGQEYDDGRDEHGRFHHAPDKRYTVIKREILIEGGN